MDLQNPFEDMYLIDEEEEDEDEKRRREAEAAAPIVAVTPREEDIPQEEPVVPSAEPLTPQPAVEEVPTSTAANSDLFADMEIAEPQRGTYTEDDLVQDQYFERIAPYMADRFGLTEEEMYADREGTVSHFINNMRGFAGGNSVRAIGELKHLWKVQDDKEKMARLGNAYQLFEEMEGIFSEDATWSETLSGMWDYTRTSIFDPANLAAGLVGKMAGRGTKATATIARKAAIKTYLSRLAAGDAVDVAQKLAGQTLKSSLKSAGEASLKEISERAATKNILNKLAKGAAIKEVAAAGGVDALVAVGTDIAFQTGMMETGVQEEYRYGQTGLAALGGLVMAGLQAGSIAMRGVSGTVIPDWKPPSGKGAATKITDVLENTDWKTVMPGDWSEKVARGVELEDLDTEFFVTLLIGNDKKGITGLPEIMLDEGFVWQKRFDEDKFSNWFSDVITETFEPDDLKNFLTSVENATGVKFDQTRTVAENVQTFGDVFARKMSDQGRVLNAASQAARRLNKKVGEVELGDYFEYLYEADYGDVMPEKFQKLADAAGKTFGDLQANVIRGIVANLSTSGLNARGWAANTLMNSSTDLALSLVHSGRGLAAFAVGDTRTAKEAIRRSGAYLLATTDRVKFLMDPEMTVDAFQAMLIKRPEALRELADVLPGGIESVNSALRKAGFDPKNPLTRGADNYIEFINLYSAARGVDIVTKSQEYVYQLNKQLRLDFDMSWNEFFSNPEAYKLLSTKRYLRSETKAVYETSRALMNQTFRGAGAGTSWRWVGEAAATIEDIRKFPGVGMLLPFGRFFNNTVATFLDGSGLSVLAKGAGMVPNRSFEELMVRGAIGWGVAFTLADSVGGAIDKGLGMFEMEIGGEVVDFKYEYPMSAHLGVAKVIEYIRRGESVPKGHTDEFMEVMTGQITRNLSDAATGSAQVIKDYLNGDATAGELLSNMVAKISTTPVAGATRWLEPTNSVIALARGSNVPDRRQNDDGWNKAFRYVEQVLDLANVRDLPEDDYDPIHGVNTDNTEKFLTLRDGRTPTFASRVMNTAGIRSFDRTVSSYTDAPDADNRYHQLLNKLIEEKAEFLWKSERWKNASQRDREALARDILTSSATSVKNLMALSNPEDQRKALALKVASLGRRKVDRFMKELFPDEDLKFEDLNYEQLLILQQVIKFDDERLRLPQ